MTKTFEKEETIITTDYAGERWQQEVGDVVIVELHGKKYETEVVSHTHMHGGSEAFSGGTIEYRVVKDEWKHVE